MTKSMNQMLPCWVSNNTAVAITEVATITIATTGVAAGSQAAACDDAGTGNMGAELSLPPSVDVLTVNLKKGGRTPNICVIGLFAVYIKIFI
jgi:hypothetical protein